MSKDVIYATKDDWLNLDLVSIFTNVSIYRTGMFDSLKSTSSIDLKELLDNIGIAKNGDWNYNDTYLIMPKESSLSVREVPQREGGIRYAIDQLVNPQSIVLNCGGLFEEKVLVASYIGTVNYKHESKKLYKQLFKPIKKHFRKVRGNWVGEGAYSLLLKGTRLVAISSMHEAYDLKLK